MQYALNDKLSFGKYRGQTIREVVEINPWYLSWAMSEIDRFDLDEVAMEKYEAELDMIENSHYPEPYTPD